MRAIIHLSDLHFGRVDATLITPLTQLVKSLEPDVVVISGDLTQRARSSEFIAARAFLDTLPQPQIVVPGNHDISLYNLYLRFMRPLAKYTRYITTDLQPFYSDAEIAVAGVNTARSLTVKDGRINDEQIELVRQRLARLPDHIVKVIVTHHPFDLPPGFSRQDLVNRAPTALQTFADCGADLLLAGHFHTTHAGTTETTYPIAGYSALSVQAGTATSTRARGEANSFNVIYVDSMHIKIDQYSWEEGRSSFERISQERFNRQGQQWRAAK